jgi:hypothetical protein
VCAKARWAATGLLRPAALGHSSKPTEGRPLARLCGWSVMLGMEATLKRAWPLSGRLGACLAVACGWAGFAVAEPAPPRMTAAQRAALERAYADLRDTRDLQAWERLERSVRPGDRFGAAGRRLRSRRY